MLENLASVVGNDELKSALVLLITALAAWLTQVVRSRRKGTREKDSLTPDSLPSPMSERSQRRESLIKWLRKKKHDEETTDRIVLPEPPKILVDTGSPRDTIGCCRGCKKFFPVSQLCVNGYCMHCGAHIEERKGM